MYATTFKFYFHRPVLNKRTSPADRYHSQAVTQLQEELMSRVDGVNL